MGGGRAAPASSLSFTGALQHGLAQAWWARVVGNDQGVAARLAAAITLANSRSSQVWFAEADELEAEVLAAQTRVLGEGAPGSGHTHCCRHLAATCADQG